MRIVVIGTRGFPGIQGGVEKHCEHLYPLLSEKNDIIVCRRKPFLSDASSYQYPHICYKDFPSTRIKGFEAFFHSFICSLYVIFTRPDIVHVHNIGPAMFAPFIRLFGIPVLLTYHSPNYEHKKWGFFSRMILRMSEKIALRFSNHIIFVNRFQMEKYGKKVKKKSVYIPNGVEPVSPSSSTSYLNSIGIKPHNYVLAVGRITPEKGFEYLIRAMEIIPTEIKLVIAGGIDHKSDYYKQLNNSTLGKRLIFTGYVDGEPLQELYAHARLFVLSSLNEGFPLVLLEAMGYGLELLVSDIPATHLIELDASCYFRAGDVHELSEKISRSLSEEYHLCRYDLAPYDWKNIAIQVGELYRFISNARA